jgi:hypothetical protein
MNRAHLWAWLAGSGFASLATANVAPTVVIESAAMRAGTTYMDVVYRVDDPDDATVKVRALAFVDGQRSLGKVLKPVTFVEGTEANIGDAIQTDTSHTLSWNVGADWNVTLGQVKFEVLAMDGRGLLPFEWITVPAAAGRPALTLGQNAPTATEVFDALLWRLATDDPGLRLEAGKLIATSASGAFAEVTLAADETPSVHGPVYVLKAMDLMPANEAELAYLESAARTAYPRGAWYAKNTRYTGITSVQSWGDSTLASPWIGKPDLVKLVCAALGSQTAVLALDAQGTVTSWNPSQPVPEGLGPVLDIAIGTSHRMAIKADGTLVAWGSNSAGQTTIPAGLGPVKAIAAGGSTSSPAFGGFSVAVKQDGTVAAWGTNTYGQATVPAGLSDVTAVAASFAHVLALKRDGTVVAWGRAATSSAVAPPAGLSGVTAISLGWSGAGSTSTSHALALKSDGTVVAWGSNAAGQTDVPAGLSGVVAVSAAGTVSLALKADGTVVAWGAGASVVPTGLTHVTAIAAGNGFGFVLRTDAP